MESKEKLLQSYVNKGFLLHGSPYYIEDEIKPNKPFSTNLEDSFKGVYATTLPAIAIFRAITPPKERVFRINEVYETRFSWDGKSFEASEDAVRALSNGFVYVLPRKSFSRIGGHLYLSTQPVKYSHRISVSPKDLKKKIRLIKPFCKLEKGM